MSILIPVISKVRTAGFDTATTHRVQAIMSAIDAYHQANNAYPGPLADDELYDANAANPTPKAVKNNNPGNMPPGVTSSENLILGLLGGAVWTPGTSTFTSVANQPSIDFDPNAVGNGPTNFNVLAQGKKYGPFAEPKACGLENNATPPWLPWSDSNHNPPVAHSSLYKDTAVPEFTDAFPDAMPILYVRAAGGNSATLAINGAPTQTGTTATGADKPVWNPGQLQAYPFPAIDKLDGTKYNGTPAGDVQLDFPKPYYYFTQGADHLTPRQRGGYLLIVAGKDRQYMTRDDRINGSPVQ
jgi:type II secretory pathway pseudopilin PulG